MAGRGKARLNPLQFGSKVRSEERRRARAGHRVLIPFNSGLRFGPWADAWDGDVRVVLIPFNSGLRFGLLRGAILRGANLS